MSILTRNITDKDLNRFERKILKNIQKYGWHANGIPGEGASPDWAYSVGLYAKYGQPELIIFGHEVATLYEMISRYADLLRAGKEFTDGSKTEGISPDRPCLLREVHVPWREPLLRSASWYYHYQEYPVLQCFWPDRRGYFPWDEHCSKRSRKSQPLLYEQSVEKTGLPKSLLIDEPWKFADSPDTACFTSNFVLKGSPITRVYHDFDGDWQFHGDQDPDQVKPKLVCLSCIVEIDDSIEELQDLPFGWMAERKSPKHKWKRSRHHPFPCFDENGYYLEDVVELAKHRDDLSPPSQRRRGNCKVGDSVKLLFRFANEDAPRKDNETERMWVTITNVDDDCGYFSGVIDNEPVHSAATYGDELQFHPLHIAEIIKKRGKWPWQSK
ncbi:MAG: DUF4262 domain-containing protein [Pirellulaceae bacterium]|nr:DUF4262 domain-containing protein [Pirellulaceae bacterium]